MAYRDGTTHIHIAMDRGFKESLDADAITFDVDTNVYVLAVLRGAMRLGQQARLFDAGAKNMALKRRARERLPWEPTEPGTGVNGGPIEAVTWTLGPWRLDRISTAPINSTKPREGEGWFLYSDAMEPVLCGWSKKEALDRAAEIIKQWEREHGLSVGESWKQPAGDEDRSG